MPQDVTAKAAKSAKKLAGRCVGSTTAVSAAVAIFGFFAAFAAFAVNSSAAELFPFVLPWDDASPGITDLSALNDKPAGRDGFVVVKDGHLHAGGKRLRIFGVNVCFGANFPTHADAEKVAARMAKFGINCVRFHHMDMQAAPTGIWAKDMKTFDPEMLDRLDYFIAQLKKHGIYSDLNLHVSRTYPDRPKAEKAGSENYDKGVDNFSPPLLALQKQYARDLLTHVNAYTGRAYVNEPAIALIEINNENALLFSWHIGKLDVAAAPYREELSALWLQWLRAKYGDDTKLAATWTAAAKAPGPELSRGLDAWSVEQHGGAAVTRTVNGGTLVLDVTKAGTESWHAQFNQAGFALAGGETYAVTFRARADAKRTVSVNLGQANDPWKVLDSQLVTLTPDWQDYRILLKPSAGEERARIGITGLGTATGKVEFTELSLRTAALDGSAPRAAFTKSEYAGRTETAQRDWYAFLWETEEKYWKGMYRFLREELKAQSLIVGTQLGWSPFPIQQHMDVIDAHAYWQHPHFPGRDWDMDNWIVKNESMAGREDGGVLAGLALQRVAGKPYIVTEYNHSAPNEYGAETFPLLCAYAALQDWDGVFAFAYSHRRDDWGPGFFGSFFDIDQHPVKMATLPASVLMFRRGDVKTLPSAQATTFAPDRAQEQARIGGPRVGSERLGVSRRAALSHRVAVALNNGAEAVGKAAMAAKPDGTSPESFRWDDRARRVEIAEANACAVIGELGSAPLKLGALTITPDAATPWASLQITAIEGENVKSAKRILITATGRAENTGMQWMSGTKDSVGRNWGRAPSLVEGVSAKITLPPGRKYRAWALDERGQRRDEVPVKDGALEIGPQHRTLWYEVAAE